jgi:transcriptional regulator with PAS, ATPase and Fis domain
MHIYRYIVSRPDDDPKILKEGLRDFYRSTKNCNVEEAFVITKGSDLEVYIVAVDPDHCKTVFLSYDMDIDSEPLEVLADHEALRYFFKSVIGVDDKVFADPMRLLNMKDDYNLALDEGTIGPILTSMYHLGEDFGQRLQSDPVIIKNSINLSEVLIDISLKISGDLKDFQILFIGNQKREINDQIRTFNKIGKQKFFIFNENFSDAYQLAIEAGCIPVTETQLDHTLSQNTLIIVYNQVRPSILKHLMDFIRLNRDYLYIYFRLFDNTPKKQISSPANLYLQSIDQINRLIEQHLNNRREHLSHVSEQIDGAVTDFYNWLYSDERNIFKGIVSADRRMQKVFDMIRRIAPSDISVLIAGETGTGKELIARAIHSSSKRSDGPFVPVNCSAIPDTLLESELFGFSRGAFTGAHTSKKGLIEIASGGTLFLDEIGDLPPIIQVKLLRVLQEREIMHLGDTKPIKVDIRLVTATNHDLEEMTLHGKFRSDLYYRVNTVQINLPALRDRREDIALLTKYFIGRLNRKSNKHIRLINDNVQEKFLHYDWPGNVRELENVLERAFALSLGEQISLNDLPQRLQVFSAENRESGQFPDLQAQTMKQIEAARLSDLLLNKRTSLSETARILGIGRTTLWRKMKVYGISLNKTKG